MVVDITEDTSFGLEDMLVGLLEGKRDQSATVDVQVAKEDALKLYKVQRVFESEYFCMYVHIKEHYFSFNVQSQIG